jgi:hypothetical protein
LVGKGDHLIPFRLPSAPANPQMGKGRKFGRRHLFVPLKHKLKLPPQPLTLKHNKRAVSINCCFHTTHEPSNHPDLFKTVILLKTTQNGPCCCGQCFTDWYRQSPQPATQDCREERCRLHNYGAISKHSVHIFKITQTNFNLKVAGESGLGKTTFINTLFSTTIKNYADHKRRHQKQVDKTVEIEITKAELEEKFFKGMLLYKRFLMCDKFLMTEQFA